MNVTQTELIQRLNADFTGRQAISLHKILQAPDPELKTGAGAGITTGTNTVYSTSVERRGNLVYTRIYIDLTGLDSDAAEGDIIGVSGTALPCHIGQLTAEQNGAIKGVTMTCLETPAGGEVDIDIYSATESTGVTDGAIGSLTETAVLASAADWTAGTVKASGVEVASGQYLYLTVGTASTPTAGTYTAGKFLIEFVGLAS